MHSSFLISKPFHVRCVTISQPPKRISLELHLWPNKTYSKKIIAKYLALIHSVIGFGPFLIIILCRKFTISPEPNLRCTSDQPVNSSLSVVDQQKNTSLVAPGHSLTASNATPPATPHCLQHLTAHLIQNGRRGLERCLLLSFWALQ